MNGLALFAGAGGLELGLHLALGDAYRTVCVVEREAFAAARLAALMEQGALDPAPIWDDVRTFDGRPWRGVVDCVSGGFPCQDISVAGKRAGIGGARSGLWAEFARIVGDVRPGLVFVENVAALVSDGLDVVLGDLAEMGFAAEWGCVAAKAVGAPHGRDRLFLLADAGRERDERRGGAFNVAARRSHVEGAAQERQRRGDAPDDRGAALADADGVGLVQHRERDGGTLEPRLPAPLGDDAGRRDAAVGDPGVSGLARRARQSRDARPEQPAAERAGRDALGDASRVGRREGRTEPARTQGRRDAVVAGDDSITLWPPGPADRAGWAACLERRPELEPAVRRVADGLADRVDRLRLCGNGVVPLAAALAFRVLADRLGVWADIVSGEEAA